MNQQKQSELSRAAAKAIIIFYAIVSLVHLGYPYAPSTSWNSNEKGKTILLDFGEEKEIESISWYQGNYENRSLELYVGSGEPTTWIQLSNLEMNRVYQWGIRFVNTKARFLKLTTRNQFTEIKELIIEDFQKNSIVPVNASDYSELFDEAKMYPGYGSIPSGTVFDEAVFARTAYEYLHGLRSYEDTHPPLGKLMISIGIAAFGMNPFGWRISGVAAGTFLLIVLWVFSRRLFKNPWTPVAVTALFALDFLHFTESRLGQIDSFLVLFMTVMYYFMYRYYEETEAGRRGLRYLAGCGIFFGLAISCKWSGFYGGAGLFLIWLVILIWRFRKGEADWKEVWKICRISMLFFVVIPAGIYLISYIPYVAFDENKGFLTRVFENQINMFQYHSTLKGTHESASLWYQWLVMIKPVKLYFMRFQGERAEILTLMGNPGLWWPGIIMMFACLYQLADRFESKAAFLVTAYAAPLLPWIFVSRYTFIYHYYPSIPYLALLMGIWAEQHGKKGQIILFVCVGVSAVLFLLFYPIITGTRVDQNYVIQWLQWLPTWKFVS